MMEAHVNRLTASYHRLAVCIHEPRARSREVLEIVLVNFDTVVHASCSSLYVSR